MLGETVAILTMYIAVECQVVVYTKILLLWHGRRGDQASPRLRCQAIYQGATRQIDPSQHIPKCPCRHTVVQRWKQTVAQPRAGGGRSWRESDVSRRPKGRLVQPCQCNRSPMQVLAEGVTVCHVERARVADVLVDGDDLLVQQELFRRRIDVW